MSSWQQRPSSSTNDDHDNMDSAGYPPNTTGNTYANVPSSPSYSPASQHESLRPITPGNPVGSVGSSTRASSYVPSPLNPNANNSRSRPVSWGGNLEKLSAEGKAEGSGSAKSSNSSGERGDSMRGIVSGTVGGGFGPYAVGVRDPPLPPFFLTAKINDDHSSISHYGRRCPCLKILTIGSRLSPASAPSSLSPQTPNIPSAFTPPHRLAQLTLQALSCRIPTILMLIIIKIILMKTIFYMIQTLHPTNRRPP
jgi:hypothetical protein